MNPQDRVASDSRHAIVSDHLSKSANLKLDVARYLTEPIVQAAEVVGTAFSKGAKLLLCGNGGSAADCQHMATEFMNQLYKLPTRNPLPAIALTTDTSFLTAYSNDTGFEGVFERQVMALGERGDVLMAISTSGNSQNVVRAVVAARHAGLATIGLTGTGGVLAAKVDIAIQVPSQDTQLIQECHLAIEHAICRLVEISPAVLAGRKRT